MIFLASRSDSSFALVRSLRIMAAARPRDLAGRCSIICSRASSAGNPLASSRRCWYSARIWPISSSSSFKGPFALANPPLLIFETVPRPALLLFLAIEVAHKLCQALIAMVQIGQLIF